MLNNLIIHIKRNIDSFGNNTINILIQVLLDFRKKHRVYGYLAQLSKN